MLPSSKVGNSIHTCDVKTPTKKVQADILLIDTEIIVP